MEDNEMHEVVQLLLARMESHPEEFGGNDPNDDYIDRGERDRWWQARTLVMDYGTKEEKAAVHAGMRKIKLKVAHEWMMDELCNGDERRRKMQEEEAAYERNLGARLRNTISPAVQQIDAQMQQEQLEAYRSIYNAATGNLQQDYNNGGLVNTIRKGLGIK